MPIILDQAPITSHLDTAKAFLVGPPAFTHAHLQPLSHTASGVNRSANQIMLLFHFTPFKGFSFHSRRKPEAMAWYLMWSVSTLTLRSHFRFPLIQPATVLPASFCSSNAPRTSAPWDLCPCGTICSYVLSTSCTRLSLLHLSFFPTSPY